MKTLRISSFGVRGFVNESLTPNIALTYAAAFAEFVDRDRILLGRDTRYSSPMLYSATLSALLGTGCEVRDLGICPTPMLQFLVPEMDAAGGLSISAGHNAGGWNALTLIGNDCAYLHPLGGEKVLDLFHAGAFRWGDWNHLGRRTELSGYSATYFDALEREIDADAVRALGPTVLIDPIGGAGSLFLEEFAHRLGIRMVAINARPTGYLPREPEPRPRSAIPMAAIIRHLQGDVGFVLSSDMSRMSLVTEDGEPASEEFTFAVIADHVLSRRRGAIVANCCTSRMIDRLAEKYRVPLVKTPVGQAYVVARMIEEGAVVGGEGSGSVCLPSFSRAFDGFLMMALVLEAMALKQVPVSELVRALPRYHIEKRSVPCGPRQGYRVLELVEEHLIPRAGATIDRTDGLRLDWEDGWVHIRPSRTEHIVRVISESVSRETAIERANEIVSFIEQEIVQS